ncbi:MAG: serine protease [Gammaproteobacteria bacterium]
MKLRAPDNHFSLFYLIVIPVICAVLSFSPVFAQTTPVDTQSVFSKYSDRVIKIQVVEKGSGAKAVIGTGFFVTAQGHIVTNYHVVSKIVHNPDRYRAELVDSKGEAGPVSVLNIDVIHDLAIVKAEGSSYNYFDLAQDRIKQGIRLYAFGYPHDIGLSIVEGNYNGYLEHAHYKKIHFTGSLNPGMSGGPTILASGKVVGINVSSAGNQISFLVPSGFAADLLARTLRHDYRPATSFLDSVRAQLLSHQESYFPDDIMDSGSSVSLGNYELPSKIAPFINCWADANRNEKNLFEVVSHKCSVDDYIYVSDKQWSGIFQLSHHLITTNELNRFRFYTIYSKYFASHYNLPGGDEEDVTEYSCETGNVYNDGITFKTIFCVRRYKKLEGLYDAVFKAAVLGSNDMGLETTLQLSGVSFEKAERLARGYLEAITWKK